MFAWILTLCAVTAVSCLVANSASDGGGRFTIFVGAFLLQCVARAIYALLLKPYWLSPLTRLPQPKGGSLFNGHFGNIYRSGSGDMEEKWFNEIPNNGCIYYRGLFNRPNVMVTSPDAVKQVLTRTYEFPKPAGLRHFAARVLGIGLFLSEGAQHRQQRKTFLPAFAPRHVRGMYPIFWSKSCEAVARLTGLSNQGGLEFEVGHWASRTAMDVVTMAMMGKDFGAIADEQSSLSKAYRALLQPSRGFLVLAILKGFFPATLVDGLPVEINKRIDQAVTTVRGTCREMLREKKHKLKTQALLGKDFLSIAVQYEDIANASEEQIIDQLTTALGAGHETISVAITWVVYMFCLHPQWQVRVRDQVRTCLPSPHGQSKGLEPTATQVESLTLLQAFIHETLRRLPSVPLTSRYTAKDCIIAGHRIPQGTRLAIPIRAINRDTRLWGPDAHSFCPNRWIGPDGQLLPTGGVSTKYGNLTFLQGARACIAKGLVKAEMACIVACWIGRFEFAVADETLMDETTIKVSGGSLSTKPLYGLHVKAKVVPGW
ncbi:hypothetical protein CDD82_7631 [Ophiocordyceps australis]|uniref:Cytochrome P450 n=1 Tax=Ophiocordyceps australis TaxID=1399860 RepID=A0A2C5YPT5_9HYPO|nr:hypothetical protein CDD82_7631 [Ophiocordyceps australis]